MTERAGDPAFADSGRPGDQSPSARRIWNEAQETRRLKRMTCTTV
jgi:hypothetical protein